MNMGGTIISLYGWRNTATIYEN